VVRCVITIVNQSKGAIKSGVKFTCIDLADNYVGLVSNGQIAWFTINFTVVLLLVTSIRNFGAIHVGSRQHCPHSG